MLSIIICSISPELLRLISKNIDDTIGVEHEIIAINNEEKNWSIAHAYNEGARQAHYPYLFFVHEDVKFHTQNWGVFIEDKLKEPNCGVIGFAGSQIKLRTYSGWIQNARWMYAHYYQGEHGKSQPSLVNVVSEQPFEEVISLDGFGMFVRKDVWNLYPFDEENLTGFHCYDLDFTLQIASGKIYKNYVCCSSKVIIEHLSLGNYNRSWCQETIRLHDCKWNKILPLMTEGIVLSKKELKYHEERCFNRFVRKLLKTDFPEKKSVLKAFLLYPQCSWKHLWHSVVNVCKYLF